MVMIINHSKQFYSNELIPETLIAVINISQELFHNPERIEQSSYTMRAVFPKSKFSEKVSIL